MARALNTTEIFSALSRAVGRISSEVETSAAGALVCKRVLLVVICCLLLGGCRSQPAVDGPFIEFTKVPLTDKGGTWELDLIEGRVAGARPGQQIVLYARSGAWYVQPFTDKPLTIIQPDSRWKNSTHLGTDYAALLVEPGYRPPPITNTLPTIGSDVIAVAITEGAPRFWQTWWFRLAVVLVFVFAMLVFYRYHMRRLTRQLNIRFEERLAERERIAQELHDTLLQGVLSASMQLDVAIDKLPADSPAKMSLGHIQQVMGQVIEEGRNAVRGLRSSNGHGSLNLEEAFSRVQQELAVQDEIAFRVIVEGRPQPLHPIIRDEVYRIGHEALLNAFRHSHAKTIEVEVEYSNNHLRLLVSDDGDGIDSQVLRSGREGHWGLSGMRERAERIGARLKVRSRAAAGTEVELSVPGHVAFTTRSSGRKPAWLRKLRGSKAEEREL